MLCKQERDREGRHEHHGRRLCPQRSKHHPVHRERQCDHDGEAEQHRRPQRPVPLRGERERVGTRHDQLPVGEVDKPQHAEDEPDPDGHERVDRAQADRIDENLPVDPEDRGRKRGRHER